MALGSRSRSKLSNRIRSSSIILDNHIPNKAEPLVAITAHQTLERACPFSLLYKSEKYEYVHDIEYCLDNDFSIHLLFESSVGGEC
jgi:hypothetical protein